MTFVRIDENQPQPQKTSTMGKTASKSVKAVKSNKNVQPSPTKAILGLRLMTNKEAGKRGRPISEDKMFLNKGGLNFNDRTRRALNIPEGSYFQFLLNDESDKTGVFYATIHKDLVSRHSMRMGKAAATNYRVMLPDSAAEMKVLKTKDKLIFRCDRVSEGRKRSYVRISLIKE